MKKLLTYRKFSHEYKITTHTIYILYKTHGRPHRYTHQISAFYQKGQSTYRKISAYYDSIAIKYFDAIKQSEVKLLVSLLNNIVASTNIDNVT